jgi:hypothetical protein
MACAVAPSHAGLIIERDPSAPLNSLTITPAAPAASEMPVETIRYVGVAPREATVARLKGFGEDLPLALAMKQIVPDGWTGFIKDKRVKQISKVSWYGLDRTWPLVLEEMLSRNGLIAIVDWGKREITLDVPVTTPGAGRDDRR